MYVASVTATAPFAKRGDPASGTYLTKRARRSLIVVSLDVGRGTEKREIDFAGPKCLVLQLAVFERELLEMSGFPQGGDSTLAHR